MEPETFIAFNEESCRELENDNYQGQQNAGTLSKYAHFSTWKTNIYISVTDQKNTPFF